MTNWAIIAEPRDDQADTEEIIDLIHSLGAFIPEPAEGAQLVLGAEIKQLDFSPKIQGLVADTVTAEFIAEVEVMIGLWPALETQLRSLLGAIYPVKYANGKRYTGYGGTYGTRSQSVSQHFGQIYATSDTPYGFAQGLVSSIANWKLYAMGLGTLDWTNTLFNHPKEELVQTPTRQEMHPFGVTAHALYAIMHVLEFDLRLADMMGQDDEWMAHAKHSIDRQKERITRGLSTSQTKFHPTANGRKLLDGVQDWANRLLTRADAWK